MAQNFKKEERKKQIKKVAIKLMLEHAYEDISVQKILDEMNYSKSGFYHCYNSKAELFMDILMDGLEYRYNQIIETKNNSKGLDRKALILELFLDKALGYNEYKKIFVKLMMEFPNDKELYAFYNQRIDNLKPAFLKFFDDSGFSEVKPFLNDEFNIFIYSLIIGTEIFDQYNSKKYRELIREIFSAYFEKKNLFD